MIQAHPHKGDQMSFPDDWLANVSEADLLSLIPTEALDHLQTPDEAAQIILAQYSKGLESRKRLKSDKETEQRDLSFPSQALSALKREFYTLLCTDDSSYAKVREKLLSAGSGVTILTVAIVAQALGDTLGLVCGPLITLVAVLIYAALRLGQQAMCATLAAECAE
jgi:hypothetical protein